MNKPTLKDWEEFERTNREYDTIKECWYDFCAVWKIPHDYGFEVKGATNENR